MPREGLPDSASITSFIWQNLDPIADIRLVNGEKKMIKPCAEFARDEMVAVMDQ